ncbi:hypothetical protein DL93DRAFT_2153196 [Clavulina sp. PMI_390]|nr:hypothetical protein DL93DRAFT_2153196 [Clavulina sp. PMI_390]
MASNEPSILDLLEYELGSFPAWNPLNISSTAEVLGDVTINHRSIPRKVAPAPDLVGNISNMFHDVIKDLNSKQKLPRFDFDGLERTVKDLAKYNFPHIHDGERRVDVAFAILFPRIATLVECVAQGLGLDIEIQQQIALKKHQQYGGGYIGVLYGGKCHWVACDMMCPQPLTEHVAHFHQSLPIYRGHSAAGKLHGPKAVAAKQLLKMATVDQIAPNDPSSCRYGIITSMSHFVVTKKVELSDGLALLASPAYKTSRSHSDPELISSGAASNRSFEFPFASLISTIAALLLFDLPPFAGIAPSLRETSFPVSEHGEEVHLLEESGRNHNSDISIECEAESRRQFSTQHDHPLRLTTHLFLSPCKPNQTVALCSGGSVTPGVRIAIDINADAFSSTTSTGPNASQISILPTSLNPEVIYEFNTLHRPEFPELFIPVSPHPPAIIVHLTEQIGHGLSSTVWKVRCEGLWWSGSTVLKLFFPDAFDAVVRETFLYEHVFKADHLIPDLIPRYFGSFCGYQGEWFGILMEDVGEQISCHDDVDPEVKKHVKQLLKRVGVDHGDLRGPNILRDSKGALRVIDFGHAELLGDGDEGEEE